MSRHTTVEFLLLISGGPDVSAMSLCPIFVKALQIPQQVQINALLVIAGILNMSHGYIGKTVPLNLTTGLAVEHL